MPNQGTERGEDRPKIEGKQKKGKGPCRAHWTISWSGLVSNGAPPWGDRYRVPCKELVALQRAVRSFLPSKHFPPPLTESVAACRAVFFFPRSL